VRTTSPFELPEEQRRALRRAKRLEWLTLAYLASVVVVMYLVLGSSQAMKTAWIEDLLSLIPPVAFLVSARVTRRHPDRRYPFGYQRATTIAYLCGALALLAMGAILLGDAILKLAMRERPSIGAIDWFGEPLWLGWLMIPALLWSGIPVVFIGRAKLRLAPVLHDKVLNADATMNKADWLTATAALAGVLGIGFGLWWADAAAAAVISFEIGRDGVQHVRAAVGDLMDRTPTTVDHRGEDSLPDRLQEFLLRQPWVAAAEVRVREEGHMLFADALVVPRTERDLVDRIARMTEDALELDWRLHDLVVMPVRELPRDARTADTGREGRDEPGRGADAAPATRH
jgi:cation diffusion facilitator family transporter